MPDFPDIGRKSFCFGADERIPEALLPIRDNGQDEVGEGLEVAPVDLLDEGMGVGAGPGERDVDRAAGEEDRAVVASPGIADLDRDASFYGDGHDLAEFGLGGDVARVDGPKDRALADGEMAEALGFER
jgi:hypothetical protein